MSESVNRSAREAFVTIAAERVAANALFEQKWRDVAAALLGYGEDRLARMAIDLFAAQSGNPSAAIDRATIYARTGLLTEARVIATAAPRHLPDPASNAFLRGTLALNAGDLPGARAALLEAADAQPLSGQIWQALASTGSMRAAPDLANRIILAEAAMAGAPESERAIYDYTLGKVLDDLGEHDRAFAAFDRGARAVSRLRPYSARTDIGEAETASAGWTRAVVADLSRQVARPTDRPIIVTGLPRSGSTLVEQILASHSAVAGGEELMRFAIAVREIGGSDLQSVARWNRSRSLDETSALYLHLLAQRYGESGRVVDKTLGVSRYFGLLAAALPDAPLIWITRDPLDCAWSCFRTWFIQGLSWSFSQKAIAAHMRLEDRLLAHWRDVLGDRLLVVSYERLVTDKETEIPRIMAHCGLSVEPQVFTPERTERAVVTASAVQVRSPINTAGLRAADPYRRHLQPFIEAYGYEG